MYLAPAVGRIGKSRTAVPTPLLTPIQTSLESDEWRRHLPGTRRMRGWPAGRPPCLAHSTHDAPEAPSRRRCWLLFVGCWLLAAGWWCSLVAGGRALLAAAEAAASRAWGCGRGVVQGAAAGRGGRKVWDNLLLPAAEGAGSVWGGGRGRRRCRR